MNFYISPENRIACEKKINKILSGLTVKPSVTFSEKTKVVKTTVVTDGAGNHEFRHEKLTAVLVEIEDIKVSEWVLVATVDYTRNTLLMGDSKLFKNIPEGYGLSYLKCDHCRSTHKSRTESHILYNTITDKWMQVGSTCVNKLINGGKYLNKLMLKLYDVIKFFEGCGEEDFGPKWRPSNKWVAEAVPFKKAIATCNKYMTEVSNTWVKAERWHGEKMSEGTNDKVMAFYHSTNVEDNDELYNTLKNYFDAKEYGEIPEYSGKTLTQKIKDTFEDEFIMLYEMYLAWFAIQMYKSDLEKPEYEQKLANLGIVKDAEFNFVGKLKSVESYEVTDYYTGRDTLEFMYTFVDDNTGIEFIKTVSNPETVNKYKDENDIYTFTGKIKYINTLKQFVTFGGRLKKTPKPKTKKK